MTQFVQTAAPGFPPAPPPRGRVWPWVLLGSVLVAVLAVGGAVALISGAFRAVDTAANATHRVSYEVFSDRGQRVTATYDVSTAAGFASRTAAAEASPWGVDTRVTGFSASVTGSIVPDLATNPAAAGTVGCRILVGGRIAVTQQATGDHATAVCMATSSRLEQAARSGPVAPPVPAALPALAPPRAPVTETVEVPVEPEMPELCDVDPYLCEDYDWWVEYDDAGMERYCDNVTGCSTWYPTYDPYAYETYPDEPYTYEDYVPDTYQPEPYEPEPLPAPEPDEADCSAHTDTDPCAEFGG